MSASIDDQAVFEVARKIDSAEARSAYLRQVCADDPDRESRVRELLRAYDESASFLESPAPEFAVTAGLTELTEKPGDTIGPYKLLQQIGEGGMGVVYMAEQKEPVKRRVALKIIKPGMDTRQVIARFEAERQALAMMDHPNIAKVLDAGATASGRPYFVMELVNGIPLTDYCDEQRLTPKARLELFVPVCQAVQHAHQKGVIHRDLKPGNILVAEFDHNAVPKVIDFGVAKATSQTLTEKTMFTQLGQIVGTLDYMSPEQAKRNQLDVDTRSDVYSLGVILYELLTGETPFDKQRLRTAAFDEMLRIIREEEPPRPSTKLSSSETLPSIAANRQVEPHKLGTLIRGELDWIVMKALEKDRARRYETASAFAADVQHYLNDEAVVACPPSAAYRLRKFARRNRTTMATTAVVALALIAGTGVATWQAIRATRQRDRAVEAEALAQTRFESEQQQRQRAERAEEAARTEAGRADAEAEKARTEAAIAEAVNEFVNSDLLGSADPHSEPDRDLRVRDVLDRASMTIEERFAEQPLVEAGIRTTIGQAYKKLGAPEEAAHHLERAHEIRSEQSGDEDPATVWCELLLRGIEHDRGNFEQAVVDLASLEQQCNHLFGSNDSITLSVRYLLADCFWHSGDRDQAERIVRDLVETSADELGPESSVTLNSMNLLGVLLKNGGRLTEAEDLQQQLAESARRIYGPEHPRTLGALNNLANTLSRQQRYAEAEALNRSVLEVQRRILGSDHPHTISTISNLAGTTFNQRNYAESEALHREALQVRRVRDGVDHPRTIRNLKWLALSLYEQRKHAVAEPLFRELLDVQQRTAGPDDADTVKTMLCLARVCRDLDRAGDAIDVYREILTIDEQNFWACLELGRLLEERGELEEATGLIDQAATNCPDGYDAYNKLGLAFRALGMLDRAETEFLKCIDIDSGFEAAPYNLTIIYIERDEPQRAIDFMQERGTEWPVLYGRALRKLGALEEAIDRLDRGLKEYTRENRIRECRMLLALVLNDRARQLAMDVDASADDLGRAEAMARKALKVTPADGAGAWAALALVQYRAGRMTEARESTTEALDRNPRQRFALLVSALLSAHEGQLDVAADALKSAVTVIEADDTPPIGLVELRREAESAIANLKDRVTVPSVVETGREPEDE